MTKIFYSWQSDAARKVNHDFIGDCLREAAAAIHRVGGQQLEVQDGVRGEPGMPSLADTIFARIAAADVYVADVSLVYQAADGGQARLAPNPNVAVELGYAIASLSQARVISIQNIHFGSAEKLPFDLRHMRWPLQYSLPPDASKEDIANTRSSLVKRLQPAITQILQDDRIGERVSAKRTEVALDLVNLIERVHDWRLALKRHRIDAPALQEKGHALTQKLQRFTDRCQRILSNALDMKSLENLRLAIADVAILIAGSPQRTEALALDLDEVNQLRQLIKSLAASQDEIERLDREIRDATP